jgi:hypothetical protein
MTEKITQISELLPEGLSESSVNEIGELMESVISEQVNEQAQNLEAKVNSFIRFKIDEIKEQAMRELELENETFKNARLFEAVRDIMTLELNGDDEDRAVGQALSQQDELHEEVGVLSNELQKTITENSKLGKTVKILNDKLQLVVTENEQLLRDVGSLNEEVSLLEESSTKPFKSSEQAVVIAENMSPDETEKANPQTGNEFLTPEVMKFMPFTS